MALRPLPRAPVLPPEMADRPDSDERFVLDALEQLRAVNRRFGALSAVARGLKYLRADLHAKQEIQILDLATGSADHPIALAQEARRMKQPVRITALDANPLMRKTARQLTRSFPEISVVEGNLHHLPYPSHLVDVVLCSSFLHYCSHDDALRVVQSMYRLARIGIIVQDLRRSRFAAASAWLYTRLTTRNPIMWYDAVQSVLRSFTLQELALLVSEAGLPHWTIMPVPLYRMLLIARSETS
jgi:SAM-dependent methyltransferase